MSVGSVVTGLAYTEYGGDLLDIEALKFEGNGKVQTTGKLGDRPPPGRTPRRSSQPLRFYRAHVVIRFVALLTLPRAEGTLRFRCGHCNIRFFAVARPGTEGPGARSLAETAAASSSSVPLPLFLLTNNHTITPRERSILSPCDQFPKDFLKSPSLSACSLRRVPRALQQPTVKGAAEWNIC